MREAMAGRLRLALLALCLPLALAAAAAAEDAKRDDAPEKQAETPTGPKGITGVIISLTKESFAVRNLAQGSGGGRSFLTLAGDPETPVSGEKKSFAELEAGDLVAVSYQGDPPKALGIRVLPRELDPAFAAVTGGAGLYEKRGREFIGWIKQVDAKTMVVRTPNPPPSTRRKAEIKTFVRTDTTVVSGSRTSWDDLKKGDRVTVAFAKGEPRPAERVHVILIAGKRPLPPGLATQLFDPAYDKSVEDVDGIGEWPPGEPWPPADPKKTTTAPQPAR